MQTTTPSSPLHSIIQKRILYLDASALRSSAGCLRKLNWTVRRGLRLGGESNYKAAYGTAVHKYLQAIDYGVAFQDAIMIALKYYEPYEEKLPADDFHTSGHLLQTIGAYKKFYKNDDGLRPIIDPKDGKALAEIKFAIPAGSSEDEEAVFCGTIDKICDYAGLSVIVDHKITSSRNQREFLEEFQMSLQLRMYIWAFWKLTGEILPAVINGVFIKKQTQKAEQKGEFDGASFARSPLICISKEELVRFEEWIHEIAHTLLWRANPEKWFNYSACYEKFAQCRFAQICSKEPELWLETIQYNYDQQPYEPLNFQD